MGIETEGAGVVEGKIPYTYKEDIEQKRLWLERKIKRELKIVINAIIDKVIWKGCNLDVLILVSRSLQGQSYIPTSDTKRSSQKRNPGTGIKYQDVRKKEVCRCYEACERGETL